MMLAMATDAPEIAFAEELALPAARELIDEGWRRIDDHDYEGARILANQALERGYEPEADAFALLGAAFELEGFPERAIPLYERALRAVPEGTFSDHMRFRLAEAYGELGDVDQALRRLYALEGNWSRDDSVKIALIRGILLIDNGQSRRGVRGIDHTLAHITAETVPFYQAKAHAAVARALTAEARTLPLDGSQLRQVRHLRERTELVDEAEQHVLSTIELKEPEWVLDGMFSLGRGFEDIGDAMLTVPTPVSISSDPELLAEYDSMMKEEVEKLYLKAERHYAEGAGVGYRLQWPGKRLDRLEAAQEAVQEKIDELEADS